MLFILRILYFLAFSWNAVFSHDNATLWEGMSVGQSVGYSFHNQLFFSLSSLQEGTSLSPSLHASIVKSVRNGVFSHDVAFYMRLYMIPTTISALGAA